MKFKKMTVGMLALVILTAFLVPFTAFAISCRKDYFNKDYALNGNMAEDVVTVAKAQKGRTGAQFGYTEAWCDEFVADCLENAGADSSIVGHGGTVADFERVMRNKGAVAVSSPRTGDLIFFTFSHVEIVSRVEDGVVYCIGGNNGSTGSYKTNYSAGERKASSIGAARLYLRPDYPPVPDPEPPEKPNPAISKTSFSSDETVTVTWKPTARTTHYWLHTYKDGEDFENKDLYDNLSYSRTYPAGKYTLFIASYNNYGESHDYVEFTVYANVPPAPQPKISKTLFSEKEAVNVTWGATANTTHYWLHSYKDGKDFENKDMYNNLSYSRIYPAGKYTLFIASYNNYGETHNCVEFTVYDSKPNAPVIQINKTEYTPDESVKLTWDAVPITTHYWLLITKDGESYKSQSLAQVLSYDEQFPAGLYEVYISAVNQYGFTADHVSFHVGLSGDINIDGKVTTADAVTLKKYLINKLSQNHSSRPPI